MEHDFIVQPGADYRQIKMRHSGFRELTVSEAGDLVIATSDGQVTVRAPAFTVALGRQLEVEGGFVVLGAGEVGFQLGRFNPAYSVVIDPVLDYATYLANLSLYVDGAAVDAAGNTYITGQAFSSAYPAKRAGAAQQTCPACPSQPDVFITKLERRRHGPGLLHVSGECVRFKSSIGPNSFVACT